MATEKTTEKTSEKAAVKTAEKKKEKKGARKLRLAKRWQSDMGRIVGRMLVTLTVIVILGMMFTALQSIGTLWLRYLLAGAVIAAMLLLLFSDGLSKGGEDAAASRFYMQMQKAGHSLEERDDAACYHPLKAIVSAAAVFALPFALAVYLCVFPDPYTYALQDLPTWLTGSYGARLDVMGALGAYGQAAAPLGAKGFIRVLVRLVEMNYINLFPDPLSMTGVIDRLSPLFVASFPLAYCLGYLCGPRANFKREKQNRRAKKVAVRKQQKSSLAKELVGVQNSVHYGQRAESEKPKRKELV